MRVKLSSFYFLIVLVFSLSQSTKSFAQISLRDSIVQFSILKVNYSLQVPFGDVAKRFGVNSTLGLGYEFKTKTNWFVGVSVASLFGNNVKEDSVLRNISTSNGYVTNEFGEYARINMSQRGMVWGVHVSKLFPVIGPNKNSGITTTLGVGAMYHYIKIAVSGDNAPQLRGDYLRGYDRMTGGWYLEQFVGYTHLGNNKRYNYYIGIQVVEGFTKSLRTVDYDTGTTDTSNRLDIFTGIKLGWMIPFYKRLPKEYYFN